MKKYESDAICSRCGATYGNHAYIGSYCPTKEQIEKNKKVDTLLKEFDKTRKFRIKKEGGK